MKYYQVININNILINITPITLNMNLEKETI